MHDLKMKLGFYWYLSEAYKDGVLRPACTCLDSQRESDEFIANYLMDDGGVFYFETISSLVNALREITLLSEKKVQFINLDRNAWGADLSLGEAKIYSLHNEDECQIIALDEMRNALLGWIIFLQSTPNKNIHQEVDLSASVGSP